MNGLSTERDCQEFRGTVPPSPEAVRGTSGFHDCHAPLHFRWEPLLGETDIWEGGTLGQIRKWGYSCLWLLQVSIKSFISEHFFSFSYVQGGIFNWSARFSVPKWKTGCSQPGLVFHEIFNVKNFLVGWESLFHFGTENGDEQLKKHPVYSQNEWLRRYIWVLGQKSSFFIKICESLIEWLLLNCSFLA